MRAFPHFISASIVAASVFCAGAAGAGVLHTPPLSGGTIRCEIKNIGTKPAEVTIEVILTGGTFNVDTITETIDPLESSILVTSGSVSVCRFTVDGSAKKFVASACILSDTGNYCLPAR